MHWKSEDIMCLLILKDKTEFKNQRQPPLFFKKLRPLHTMKTALNYALFYKEQRFTVVSCSEVQTKERKLRFEAFFSLLNLLLHISVLCSHSGWSHTMLPAPTQLPVLETDVHSFPISLLGSMSALFIVMCWQAKHDSKVYDSVKHDLRWFAPFFLFSFQHVGDTVHISGVLY